MLNRNVLTGIALGVGLAALVPGLAPAIARMVRPAAKAAVKGGLTLYERGREALAEAGEAAEDMIAEVQAELDEELAAAEAPEKAAAGGGTARPAETSHSD